MTIITIPRELKEGGKLVAVPQKHYEDFLAWEKAVKSKKVFTPTATERKALAKARKDYKAGKYITLLKRTSVNNRVFSPITTVRVRGNSSKGLFNGFGFSPLF